MLLMEVTTVLYLMPALTEMKATQEKRNVEAAKYGKKTWFFSKNNREYLKHVFKFKHTPPQ